MDRLSLKDKIKIINSVLFIVLGIVIIVRTMTIIPAIHAIGHAWLSIIVGISFTGFGIYRSFYILKYLRGRI